MCRATDRKLIAAPGCWNQWRNSQSIVARDGRAFYSFTIKDPLPTFVSTLCSCRGHGRAGIQQAVVPCQEVLCKAHGESLQHQSACTEVVNWLISAHYSDPSGTWVPFRALRARGGKGGGSWGSWGRQLTVWERGKLVKKEKNEGNERQTVVFFSCWRIRARTDEAMT